MRTYALAVIGTLILAGVGGWVTSTLGKAQTSAPAVTQVDTLQIMGTARNLPSPRYDLY
jgi:hypothetical protein